MPATFNLSDVFISYSRKDKTFVQQLHDRLKALEQQVWVDWEDIPPTADWWSEIEAGIDGANTFVFIISPDSVTSEVCYREVDYAVKSSKRFVPVLHREITDPDLQKKMHPSIGSHNWIIFEDPAAFDTCFQSLVDALQTDLNYVRLHTRLLVQARDWDSRGRDPSFLLSGTAVHEAHQWLASSTGKTPPPTRLHTEYILASQHAQARRQRNMLLGVSVALAVAVALTILSFILYQQSEENRVLADANAQEAEFQAATSVANADLAATNESRANVNADRAATNEAEAFAQGTAVANQAATSVANADLAATNESRANVNANRAATNEAEAFMQGTAVANQAATSVANADLAATNAAEAEAQANRAEVARQQSQAIALAAEAELALGDEDTEFATLVGIEALANYPYTWEAERVLGMAVEPTYTPALPANVPQPPADPFISPDGQAELTILPDRPQQAIISRADGSTLTLIGHTDDITGAAWSPDSQLVATISKDTTVRIWRADTGQSYRTLLDHESEVTAVAWSPDGSRLVTAARDGTLDLWDALDSVLPITLFSDRDDITQVAYEGDSVYMVTADGAAFRWRLWADREGLLARARLKVGRRLTDEEAAFVGLPPAPSDPPPAEIASCEDALPSALYPGVFARVSSKNNLLPLRLHDAPGLDTPVTRKIAPDQTFEVLDGPECIDGLAWFEVVYGINARRGWVAEGEMTADDPDYFAEPIPGR